MRLCLLHGFWGQPDDWQKVLLNLSNKDDVFIPNLYNEGPLSPDFSLAEWTKNFLRLLEKRWSGQTIDLVGYSMGGRLALHAVKQRPDLFRRVLLISTRPGLHKSEVPERLDWVEKWKDQFTSATWSSLLNNWDGQEVFKGTEIIGHRCDDNLRPYLAESLDKWSLINHEVNWDDLQNLPESVDWYFGATDQKLQSVLKDLQLLGVKGQKKTIDGAGHRILWDRPEEIAQWIEGGPR
jgi:2-succinyl-6-hydroxy-2,4-cyclohexadiene-1-carboxylate synthase